MRCLENHRDFTISYNKPMKDFYCNIQILGLIQSLLKKNPKIRHFENNAEQDFFGSFTFFFSKRLYALAGNFEEI